MNNWKHLTVNRFDELGKTSNTLHHAAQFLAYAGIHFVEAKADDSHTSAQWVPEKNWLAGQVIEAGSKRIRVILDYPEFVLRIAGEDMTPLHTLVLDGLTKQEVLNQLTGQFHSLGMDTSGFNDKLHYQIPRHEVDNGAAFSAPPKQLLNELAHYRTNGHLVMTRFAKRFQTASPLLVWPHHFDEGSYIPLQFEGGEAVGSVSIGLAVADAYYPYPYFYVTAWKKEGINYENLPGIKLPGKWHTHEWTGQVLEGNSLVSMEKEKQENTANRFLEKALKNAVKLIGWTNK